MKFHPNQLKSVCEGLCTDFVTHQASGMTKGQSWDWLAQCQYTVTEWDNKCDLQLVSQCGNMYICLRRWDQEIHKYVAETLNNPHIAY